MGRGYTQKFEQYLVHIEHPPNKLSLWLIIICLGYCCGSNDSTKTHVEIELHCEVLIRPWNLEVAPLRGNEG